MKHIYIFDTVTRASGYGIGSYLDQLTRTLEGSDLIVTRVTFNAPGHEISVRYRKGIRYIDIPVPHYAYGKMRDLSYLPTLHHYSVYLLQPYIAPDQENIFHLNSMQCLVLAKRLKEFFPGKIILTVHYMNWGLKLLGNKAKLLMLLRKPPEKYTDEERETTKRFFQEKELLHACDRIIAISRSSYENLHILYQVPCSKLALIPNALSDISRTFGDISRLRAYFHFDNSEIIILFAGRLNPGKGVDILVKAFHLVLKEFPEARLVIAGSGTMMDVLQKMAAPAWSKISFTGFLDKKHLSALYSAADIGVVPSLYEEFGYVPLEMMMHRLPVIVNDVGGLSEIIEDGTNGLHTQLRTGKRHATESARNLADRILFLLENPDQRRRMGRNGRKRYVQDYNGKKFRAQVLEFYSER